MASVGDVTVKVLPDISEFEPALREHIRRVIREELSVAFGSASLRTYDPDFSRSRLAKPTKPREEGAD